MRTAELQQYLYEDNNIWEFHYPVLVYPEKITSVSFDKDPIIEGTLSGIKGQYLIFSDGRVLNLRKHSGYFIELTPMD